MNKVAQELVKIAKMMIADESPDFRNGYEAGVEVAHISQWSIMAVLQVAVDVVKRAGIPELNALIPVFENEMKDWEAYREQEGRVKMLGKNAYAKSKKFGTQGILGAIAGMLEDANAHTPAGVVYNLARKMNKESGSGDAAIFAQIDESLGELLVDVNKAKQEMFQGKVGMNLANLAHKLKGGKYAGDWYDKLFR